MINLYWNIGNYLMKKNLNMKKDIGLDDNECDIEKTLRG